MGVDGGSRRPLVIFGKVRHATGVKFDFAYALAKATGEPRLFKGEDFSKTDLPAAA